MGAIAIHHTATTDDAWDAGEAERNLKADQDAAYYRREYAWADGAADATTKSAYRFPHHEVSADGKIGAANVKACQSGIGDLNGGRGGTTIPEADRAGVHAHLAAHLRDAGMEPPELKSHGIEIERRSFGVSELRVAAGDDGKRTLTGHAAVFDQLSEPIFFFRERIKPGAFAKTIQEADVRALWNHDPNYVLGRNRAGTLRLREDAKGLAVEIDPPDTQWARDLMQSIERGDVSQMSFGFRAVSDSWEGTIDEPIRVLEECALFDVSPVTYPAYPQTDVSARSAELHARLAPPEPRQEPHSEGRDDRESQARLAIMRRRLDLAIRL